MTKLAALALSALSGCATTMTNSQVAQTARPGGSPTQFVTEFEDSLTCMDGLFDAYGVRGVPVVVSYLRDATGQAPVGGEEWLLSAVQKMSERSNAFVATEPAVAGATRDNVIGQVYSDYNQTILPVYFVRGVISAFAGGIAADGVRAGAGTVLYGGATDATTVVSTVGVDLNVGDMRTRAFISRAGRSNEIALRARSNGAQVGGVLRAVGANLEFITSRSDSVPHAVRTLIELNAIESFGRLTGAPYWTCLPADAPNAPDRLAAVAKAQEDIFYSMHSIERVLFVQQRLGRIGLYEGPLDGVRGPALEQALADFRARYALPAGDELADFRALLTPALGDDLLPGGRIAPALATAQPADRALAAAPVPARTRRAPIAATSRARKTDQARASATDPEPTAGIDEPPPPARDAPAVEPVDIGRARPRDEGPADDAGSSGAARSVAFTMRLAPASARADAPHVVTLAAETDLFVYCFVDGADGLTRIFPNRWQANSLLPRGKRLRLPGKRADFVLAPPLAAQDARVYCYGATADLDRQLSDVFAVNDLSEPLAFDGPAALTARMRDAAAVEQGALIIRDAALRR